MADMAAAASFQPSTQQKRQSKRRGKEREKRWRNAIMIKWKFDMQIILVLLALPGRLLSLSIYWLLSVIYLNCCLMITIIPNVKIKFPRFHALPSSSSASLSISNCFDVWINFNFIMLLRHLSCLLRLESWVVLSENHLRELCAQTHYTRLKSSVIKMIFHRLPSLIRHTLKGFTNNFFSIITIALATKDLNAKLITHFFDRSETKKNLELISAQWGRRRPST